MPRYFFNTRLGDDLIADPEGEELRNPDRAWEVARAMIRELLKTEGAERGEIRTHGGTDYRSGNAYGDVRGRKAGAGSGGQRRH